MITDAYGNQWDFPLAELCPTCKQPDSCDDCNHQPLSPEEVMTLGGVPRKEDQCTS